jgi:hypothetical protein
MLDYRQTIVLTALAAAMVISLSSGAVFAGAVMARVANMALSISRFVCVEMVERLLPTRGHRSSITMMRVVAIVYMAIKASQIALS